MRVFPGWIQDRECALGDWEQGEYLQLLIDRGKEIWGSWVIVSGCRSFQLLKMMVEDLGTEVVTDSVHLLEETEPYTRCLDFALISVNGML